MLNLSDHHRIPTRMVCVKGAQRASHLKSKHLKRDVSVIQPPFSQSDVKLASLVLIQPMKAVWRIQDSIKKNFSLRLHLYVEIFIYSSIIHKIKTCFLIAVKCKSKAKGFNQHLV